MTFARFAVSIAALLIVGAALGVSADESTFAWVDHDGTVRQTSSTNPLNVTRIKTGHYCFNKQHETACYYCWASVSVTLQHGGSPMPGNLGFATANTGWGDDCNPYGGTSVTTFDRNGQPADFPFTMIVMTSY